MEIIASEVRDTDRVGDLYHRLMRGDEGRFFADRPAWQRAIVLVAGSTMHFLIAIVLLVVGFGALPQPTAERSRRLTATPVRGSSRPWHRRSWGAVGGASSPHMDQGPR